MSKSVTLPVPLAYQNGWRFLFAQEEILSVRLFIKGIEVQTRVHAVHETWDPVPTLQSAGKNMLAQRSDPLCVLVLWVVQVWVNGEQGGGAFCASARYETTGLSGCAPLLTNDGKMEQNTMFQPRQQIRWHSGLLQRRVILKAKLSVYQSDLQLLPVINWSSARGRLGSKIQEVFWVL